MVYWPGIHNKPCAHNAHSSKDYKLTGKERERVNKMDVRPNLLHTYWHNNNDDDDDANDDDEDGNTNK